MDIKKKIWKAIREIRVKKWLTQEQFSNISKLHRTYIWWVERWERNISVENLEIIANWLKVDIKEFFE